MVKYREVMNIHYTNTISKIVGTLRFIRRTDIQLNRNKQQNATEELKI